METFIPGDVVIVNTGNKDSPAIIVHNSNNKKGYYWKEQDCYDCRFTNGTSQFIKTKFIKHVKNAK